MNDVPLINLFVRTPTTLSPQKIIHGLTIPSQYAKNKLCQMSKKNRISLILKTAFVGMIFSVLLVISVSAQNNSSSSSNIIIPPPPNAAALTAYSDIQVGLYTGKPDINLELLKLDAGAFSIPVGLQYDPSLRVSSYASRVGFGWSLNCGGVITRSIVGVADELGGGFNASHNQLPQGDSGPTRRLTNLIRSIRDGAMDGEPDIYSYSLPQGGGRFINTGEGFFPQPNSGIKIEKIQGTAYSLAFKLTDEKGYQYFFNDPERTEYSVFEKNGSAPTAWYLSKIVTPNKTDSLLFSYESHIYKFNGDYSETLYEKNSPGGEGIPSSYQNQQQIIYGVLLSSIKSSIGTLKFYYSNRLDCEDKKIDQIVLLDQTEQEVLKKITFQYDYFSGNTKLRLLSYAVGNQDSVEKEYQFRYTGNSFPASNSKSQDHWGYFNGENNSSWIPSHNTNSGVYVSGANKEANPNYLQSGLLTRITYPTGGFTDFQFEPNEYSSTILGGPPDGGDYPLVDASESLSGKNSSGRRVEQTITVDFEQRVTVAYHVGNCKEGDTGGKCTSPASLPPSTTVMLQLGSTNLVKYVAPTTTVNQTAGGSKELTLGPGTYKLVVETPDVFDFGFIVVDKKRYDYTTPIKKWVGGGVRIKSITSGDGVNPANNIIKTYDYSDWTDPGKSTGTLINKPRYKYSYTDYIGSPEPGSPARCINPINYTVWSSFPGNISTVAAGAYVFYPKAIERTSGNGETRYEYKDDNSYNQVNVPPFRVMTRSWKENLIAKKTYYNNALQPLKEEKFDYQFDTLNNLPRVRCVRVGNSITCTGDAIDANGEYNINEVYFDTYYYTFEQLKYKGQTVTEFDGVSPVITTRKSWFEDVYSNLTREESVDNKGRTDKTLYTYADSYAQANAAYAQMKIRNMVGIPVEKKTFKDASLTMTEKYNFGLWHNDSMIAMSSMEKSYGDAPLEVDLLINQYDRHGNITEQQIPRGIKQVYLWGYKSKYPVAKIMGSTYSEVAGLVDQNNLDNPASEDVLRNYLNTQIRLGLPRAQVSTFTYKPLVGMWSQTDPKGQTTYYEYDGFQRLKYLRDQDRNVIKNYQYNYRKEELVYGNDAMSRTFNKSCPPGAEGSAVEYFIPAGKHSSIVSKAEANQLATNDLNTNGQANADEKGSCIPTCNGEDQKMINGKCETGRRMNVSSVLISPGRYKCTYYYQFSNNTKTSNLTEYNSRPCAAN